ncbi:hypothetical protein [Neolewinella agarilytica]|uniref:Uncharacterized protein n=1 Tax=Neolewinella agarilytica TaxID=478744 RepID=A0A1H8ZB14_9BACT|nr:hypothetical protein [Neolewinella agarilytica]SEP61586.1 hypothetical protein SAMN05444359_101250 [Neolewinella agarilytica]
MRSFFTLSLLLAVSSLFGQFTGGLSPQADSVVVQDSSRWAPLLVASHWCEKTKDSREGYVLTLDLNENFTEDAGQQPNRKFQFMRGRWVLDTVEQTITLAIDGLMSGGSLHQRYLRGRDYFIVYDIISLTTEKLELKDRLTGKRRDFNRTEAEEFKDPMINEPAKLELPQIKGGLKIPGGWG